MIFGLEPHVFFAFLSWPVTYIVIALIMYVVMAKNDKKEEAWEKAYDEWQASLKDGNTETAEGGDAE
jgi:preprotein translocase subunit YajC